MHAAFSRKEFLLSMGALLVAGSSGFSPARKKYQPLISFSTLGCPDWSMSEVLQFAAAHRFNGIELRGIKRQMDLSLCPEFASPTLIREFNALVKSKSLSITDLGASCVLHHEEGPEREKSLAEAKRFIDLAAKLHCKYIRVFPNEFPAGKDREQVMQLIIGGLKLLGDYAAAKGVTVLMETHGDVTAKADILKIISEANHPHTGLVWDVVNMWEAKREPVAEVYKSLKPYIRHVHIKDAITSGEKPAYTFLGKGDTPIFEAIDLLVADGFKGFFSFEWEKLWHPELPEPEIALAAYADTMIKRLNIEF